MLVPAPVLSSFAIADFMVLLCFFCSYQQTVNSNSHQRTLVMHSELLVSLSLRSGKGGNRTYALKNISQNVSLSGSQGWAAVHLPSVRAQHYCSAGSQQHHPGPPLFIVLSLGRNWHRHVITLFIYDSHNCENNKSPIHSSIRKVTISVCDSTGLGPSIVQREFTLKPIWSHCTLQQVIVY